MAETSMAKGLVAGALLAGGRRVRREMVSPGGGFFLASSAAAANLGAQTLAGEGSTLDNTLETAATVLPVAMGVGGWVDKITQTRLGLQRFLKVVGGGGLVTVGTAVSLDSDRNPFNGIPNPLEAPTGRAVVDAAIVGATVTAGWVAGDGLHRQTNVGPMPKA